MMGRAALLALLLIIPDSLLSTTSHDLRSRIQVDGNVLEYEPDEWILDASTSFPEQDGDSRWGRDNDIQRIALTWDHFNLYVAISCVTMSSTLMLFLDTDCGGPTSLGGLDFFRRNIRFADFSPNFLLSVSRVSPFSLAGICDCSHPFHLLEKENYEIWFLQDGPDGGALEVAIPWDVLGRYERENGARGVPEAGAILRLLAAVTGGPGTGSGDAAPDPSTVLENDPTRLAVLDNTVRIPLDQDGDALLDMGVSPREVASFSISHKSNRRQTLPVGLHLSSKVFSPDKGEVLRFLPVLDSVEYPLPVYLTARVYAASGILVSVIYKDKLRIFSDDTAPQWDEWDGRDLNGNIAPGGIYILALSASPGKGPSAGIAKATFAVIR